MTVNAYKKLLLVGHFNRTKPAYVKYESDHAFLDYVFANIKTGDLLTVRVQKDINGLVLTVIED